MAKTIPFSQHTQAARARAAKAALLPLPRATADELALQVHLALDALRRGKGNLNDAQTLTQTMILVSLLTDAGYGTLAPESLRRADALIAACFDEGRATGVWALDMAGFRSFAEIVTLYDHQLQKVPFWAVAEASDKLDRFKAGLPFDPVAKKRA
ncbi:hypothetical protein [Paraburkholderia sp. DHOC27]|uniref:hypothetical protein n=1 Tax=Paraburkholderia sp. DHOC27 TaxID=2303330 RepID=UPI000E3DCB2B|nr:hypothetical protein [Paraburkholderia sp. DHOC27]RFU46453.1 hypothetical protein D0B32_15605 [Paraburkholderia sp. DHOC27]